MWTPAALASEFRAYRGLGWRVVEAQHRVSTMALVDTLDEQEILEDLIEEVKPPVPPAFARFHWLIATPFRYAPYPHGSRFRRAQQSEGVFYAAESVETALAETAFYRLLFFAESPGTTLPAQPVEHTVFSVRLATDRALDLTAAPLDRDAGLWTRPTDYAACQDLADAARQAGAGLIRYASVRDAPSGRNLAVLAAPAFAARTPARLETWQLLVRREGVDALRPLPERAAFSFPRARFSDPRL